MCRSSVGGSYREHKCIAATSLMVKFDEEAPVFEHCPFLIVHSNNSQVPNMVLYRIEVFWLNEVIVVALGFCFDQ